MADLKLNGITPNGVGKIKLGSSNVQKIYNSSTLVWPIAGDPADPYTPIYGTPRLITANDAVITLYDTSFNQLVPPNPFSSLPSTAYELAGVSDDLTYMVACGSQFLFQNIKISQNGGSSFGDPFSGTFPTRWDFTMASKSGKVIVSAIPPPFAGTPTTNENWMLSVNGGANFTKITFPGILGVATVHGVAMSSGGKYIALSFLGYSIALGYRNYLFYSRDYGTTWLKETTFGALENRRWKMLISGTGQYMAFIDVFNSSNSFYSLDYGASFSSKSYNFGSSLYTNSRTIGAVMNQSGQYYIVAKPIGNQIDYGDNYAATMTSNALNVDGSAQNVRISNNGETQLWFDSGAGSPDYGISLNFGTTWTGILNAPSEVDGGPLFLVDVS